MTRIRLLWIVLALLAGLPAGAQDVAIPDELAGWESWVLHGEEFRRCPFLVNRNPGDKRAHVCAWPGVLSIDATRFGARFTQTWDVLEEGWVRLPGDAKHWPDDVIVNGARARVRSENNVPVVWLEQGDYDISGSIPWTTRPTRLVLPPAAGLVRLKVDGKDIPLPRFDGSSVWLGDPPERQASEVDALRLQVYRLVTDSLPLELDSVIRLEVAGKNREVELGRVLPPGFIPMSLASALPARLTVDGDLTVQLSAGSHRIEFAARAKTAANEVAFQAAAAGWPDSEVWSFERVDALRISEPSGGSPIDPDVSGTPWTGFPAFVMSAGDTLSIEEKSRGMTGEERNDLRLERRLWLDFDGEGLTARDTLNGVMRSGWRLDMTGPYDLQEASLNDVPLLITRSPDGESSGVELRQSRVNVESTSRVDKSGSLLPVTGWNEQFSEVRTTLSVPPGFRLLAAPGSDEAAGAWIERWRLLDIFIALLVAVAVSRILGMPAGIATLAMMVLTYHEPGALRWSWVSLVAAIGLMRVAPEGRLRQIATWFRNLSFVAVALLALPFAAEQLRMTLFPQLENESLIPLVYGPAAGMREYGAAAEFGREEMLRGEAGRARRADAKDMAIAASPEAMEMQLDEVVVTGAKIIAPKKLERYASDTLVQSGAGRPSWSWNNHRIVWRGPVVEDQGFRLLIAPRWVTALWHVFGVGLLALVVYWLARASFGNGGAPGASPVPTGTATAASAMIVAGLLALTISSTPAQAETPSPEILQELKRRLTEPPECVPDCAEIVSARLDAAADSLSIGLEVHTHAGVAFPLPGSVSGFRPQRILVDGVALDRFYQEGGHIWLALDPGVHVVSVSGMLPPLNAIAVPFREQPRHVEFTSRDWDVEGIIDNRVPRGAITLRRRAADDAKVETALTPEQFPAFVNVTRDLSLGLDWTVRTVVTRVAPRNGAINLRIPLLGGEKVLTEGIAVEDEFVRIALGTSQRSIAFESTLPSQDRFSLTAPEMENHAETWRLNVSPVWRAEHSGVPPILALEYRETYWPEFHPLPGETLTVTVSRPEAAAGETIAIDNVRETVDVGKRARSVKLELSMRSTRGGTHEVTLPDGADLESVTIDNEPVLLRLADNRLAIPLEPGSSNVVVNWRETDPVSTLTRSPGVDLGVQASNVHMWMTLPANRWTLLTFGPRLGPAVLLWAELVAFALIAIWLGRSAITPLKTTDWLLLGLGLSTISWPMLFVFGFWILALSLWRRREPAGSELTFNAGFVMLGVFSVTVLLGLLFTVPEGLLGRPDMHITGNGSSASVLRWFADRATGLLPQPSAVTVPLWVYKAFLLVWALWLSFALIRWLKWAWTSWTAHGYWRRRMKAESYGN